MTKRSQRDYWQRDDNDQQHRRDFRSPSHDERDRHYQGNQGRYQGNQGSYQANQGSYQAHDRSQHRDERWRDDPSQHRDERWHEDRWGSEERGHHPERFQQGSERYYGQGHDYRAGQDYRSGQEQRWGQDWGSDYRSNQYGNIASDYRGQDYRNQQRSSESYRNQQGTQVPYAGSGEPRWGESRWGEPHRQGLSDSSYSGRSWEGSRSSYDANRSRPVHSGYPNYGLGTEDPSIGGFFGKGPKGYTRSDERIREDVCDRLSYDDELDASDITVLVSEGEVTLEGNVPDRRSKHRAEDIADSVNGVRDVHNKLKARRGFMQEVGDRLMGREEEHEHGHSGSGTRNSPSGVSSTQSTQSSSSTTGTSGSAISPAVMTSGAVRNGR